MKPKSLLTRFGQLNYPQKFTLISALFILPLIAFSPIVVEQFTRTQQYGYYELYGTYYLQPLQDLLEHVQTHQQVSAEISLELATTDDLAPMRANIQQDFEALEAVNVQYADELLITTEVSDLKAEWTALEENYAQLSKEQIQENHALLETSIQNLIQYVGNTSFLILDPELDTYYLMDAVLLRLPDSQTLFNKLKILTTQNLNNNSLPLDQGTLILTLVNQLQDDIHGLEMAIGTALQNNKKGQFASIVTGPLQEHLTSATQMLDYIEENFQLSSPVSATPQRLNEVFDRAQTAHTAFYDAVSEALLLGIQDRIERYSRNVYLPGTIGIISVLIGFWIGLTVMRTISRPLGELAEGTQRLALGDLSARVNINADDEVGKVGQAFNNMAYALESSQRRIIERNKAIAASAEVSRQLSTILDTKQLVLQVVKQVQSAFNYYHAHIYLFDEPNRILKIAGGTGTVGRILLERGHAIPLERGLVGRAARTKAPVWALDTTKEIDWLPNSLLPETKSEIAVPIVTGNEVLGVLDVQNNVANSLTQDDVDLLQAIANQVAIGLQNAHQYEETQLLFQASQSLATASNYQEMLEAFLKYAAPQSDQGSVLVFNSNDERQLLSADYVAAWSRHADQTQPVEIGTRFALEQIPFISFFVNGQPLIVSDTLANTPGGQTASPEIIEVLNQFGVQSLAGFPLILGEKLLGAVLFGYARPHIFTEHELQPVQTLASQMAVLLRNQQLLAETQGTLAQLDMINRRLTREGWREHINLFGGLKVEDLAPGLSQRSSEKADQHLSQELAGNLTKITLPIAIQSEEIGTFSLQHDDPEMAFTDQDLELLQIVADEVAVALENIRLVEETQRNAVALEESRNLLDSIVENLPIHLFVKDAKELRYVRWNKAGEEILGIPASEAVGKTVYEIFDKETADRSTGQDWEVLTRQSLLEIEEEIIETPHRGERIVHTLKTPVLGADGQPRYLIGLSEDITERKQAEKALLELEALYRRAIASADAVPYSRRYTDETFSFIGEGIEDLTGYTPEEFTATLFDSLILESQVYSVADLSHFNAVQLTRAGRAAHWKADYRIRGRDGKDRWLADSSVEIIGPEGISIGSVGILTDITERKRAEEVLNQQIKEMENLNVIGQIISAQQDLDSLLILSGEKICETFNVDSGYIALYDQRSEMFQFPFYLNDGHQTVVEPQSASVGLAGRVLNTRQTLLFSEMTKEVAQQLGVIIEEQIPVSWLGAPIFSGGEVIGVISVQHATNPYWFKEADIRLLNTITANLSTAVQNIRLLERTQATLSELEHLTRRLTREGWQDYIDTTVQEMGYSYDLKHIEPITTTIPLNGNVVVEKPLIIQGEAIGRLVVSETDQVVDQEMQEIVSAVSQQLSAHLENLRLTEQTQQRASQLEEATNFLDSVLENLPVMLFVKDATNLQMLRWNKAGEEIVGLSRDAMIGKTDYDFWPQEQADFFAAKDREVISGGFLIDIPEEPIATPAGTRYLHTRKIPVMGSDGKPLYLLGISEDITERKKAAEILAQQKTELEEAAKFLETIIETLPVGLFMKDAETLRFTRWNKSNADIIGLASDEVLGKNDYDFFPTEEAESFIQKDREVLSGFSLVDIPEEVVMTSHKGKRFLHTRKIPILDANNQPRFLLGISEDITERKLIEETLAKRATELSTVAEVSTTTATELNPDELLHKVVNLTKASFDLYHAHIYLLNDQENTLVLAAGAGEIGMQMVMEGRTIPLEWEQSLVARVARERTGVVVNDVRAEPDFLPHPLLPETRAELAVPMIVGNRLLGVLDVQANKTNYFTDEDIRIQATLASQISVALQNARLYVEQSATVQRLRELDHLKSSFLANMSHELRTPLNSIIGFTEIILEGIDGPLTEYMEGDLKIIQKNGKHLLSLINDVLDMAKIEAGRMNLSYERFMLSELLEDVVDITTSLAHDKHLYLRIDSEDAHETELLADRIRLRQVLINVVGNAVKFTETGGVTLRTLKKDGKLWIKVVDTGMGIPPEKLENVFDHFSQVDTSTTRKAGGTGLGLPISRRLVELHQGLLFAESSGIEGQGSTFNLVLPLDIIPLPQF